MLLVMSSVVTDMFHRQPAGLAPWPTTECKSLTFPMKPTGTVSGKAVEQARGSSKLYYRHKLVNELAMYNIEPGTLPPSPEKVRLISDASD